MPLPAGTTLDHLVAELQFVMSHYPTMRTRVRIDPAGPKQVVAGSGEIRLEIVDVAEHHDPAAVAEQIRQRYWDGEYDFATDWPVRMAVIRQLGVPTHRVWVMCHLATDGAGVSIILAELADRAATSTGASVTCGTGTACSAPSPFAASRIPAIAPDRATGTAALPPGPCAWRYARSAPALA